MPSSTIWKFLKRIGILALRFWGGGALSIISLIVVIGYQRAVSQLIESTVTAVFQMTVVLFCYFLMLWSYYRTNFTRPSPIPEAFRLSEDELNMLKSQRGFLARAYANYLADLKDIPRGLNLCMRCRLFVPPRAHHCRICGRCILRMDHHCPFFGNCIHFGNMKFFLLTLIYAFVSCAFIVTTLYTIMHGPYPHFDKTNRRLSEMDEYLLTAVFAISMASSLAIGAFLAYCLWHVFRNSTPVELFIAIKNKYPRGSPYDNGAYHNWREIFGPVILAWFLPLSSTVGDGVTFREGRRCLPA
ncbi:palmitoyltransferase ZDHHC20-like [Galendromus occidentalis]|uniref:Palmitoyltransferase n=1 Tax=Galendromus occidentalis TaxID=34638 RepID=A0AAJ6QXX4_9ACAR|nr:palmitoyltransferase ZDHHC20-like [Galendromus occidentalis]